MRSRRAKDDLLTVDYATKEGYPARTAANVRAADVTIAFAKNFATPGERLTRRLAGRKYVPVLMDTSPGEAAEALVSGLLRLGLTGSVTVNIAGNALDKLGTPQESADLWVRSVMERVVEKIKIVAGRSGGQSGIDEAGARALLELGVPTTVLMPRGGTVRTAGRRDVSESKSATRDRLLGTDGRYHP
jgi:hypothetical protein